MLLGMIFLLLRSREISKAWDLYWEFVIALKFVRRLGSTAAKTPAKFQSDITSSLHYNDVIMGSIASQINSLTIVYSAIYSGADQRKHQSSASLAFVRGIHRGPVNSPHKWPVTRKMFPFDDVIMLTSYFKIFRLILIHLNIHEPEQSVRHEIFKSIFLNENVWMSNKISLTYVPQYQIGNKSALVQAK